MCTYSPYFFKVECDFILSLIKYSTAFTSCFVVTSSFLIFSASLIEKLLCIFKRKLLDELLSFGKFLISFKSDRNINHFTSTRTLFLINAYSEKSSAMP